MYMRREESGKKTIKREATNGKIRGETFVQKINMFIQQHVENEGYYLYNACKI